MKSKFLSVFLLLCVSIVVILTTAGCDKIGNIGCTGPESVATCKKACDALVRHTYIYYSYTDFSNTTGKGTIDVEVRFDKEIDESLSGFNMNENNPAIGNGMVAYIRPAASPEGGRNLKGYVLQDLSNPLHYYWISEPLDMSEIKSESTYFEFVLESGASGIRSKDKFEFKKGELDASVYDNDEDCQNGFQDRREWIKGSEL